MSTQKLQVGRALLVIPSDNCDVPFPALSTSGTNTSVVANRLVDSAATFVTKGIQPGDIIYSSSLPEGTFVVNVISETVIQVANDIFTTSGETYSIYAGSNNDGCVLYIGTAGTLTVTTNGGDVVTFNGLSGGQFFPVHVKKVHYSGTSCTGIIAMW